MDSINRSRPTAGRIDWRTLVKLRSTILLLALCGVVQTVSANQGSSGDPNRTNRNVATISEPQRQLQQFEGTRDRGPDSTMSGGRGFNLPDSTTPAPEPPRPPNDPTCPEGTLWDPARQRCVRVSNDPPPPPPPPPVTCQDPAATNFGQAGTCIYPGGPGGPVNPPPPPPPPPGTCPAGSPAARGAAGALPYPDCGCPPNQTYNAASNSCGGGGICQDSTASNYGGLAPCQYPPPPTCRYPAGSLMAVCECEGAGVAHRILAGGNNTWSAGACPGGGGAQGGCVQTICI